MANENIKSEVRLAFFYDLLPNGKLHTISSVAEKFNIPRTTVSTWANEEPNDTWEMQRKRKTDVAILNKETSKIKRLNKELTESIESVSDGIKLAIRNLKNALTDSDARMSPKQIMDMINLFDILAARIDGVGEDDRVIEGADFEIINEEVETTDDIDRIRDYKKKLKELTVREL